VVGALAALVGGLRLYQALASPHPELVRKLLHVGMGLVASTFPWLFDRSWPVLALGVVSLGTMASLRLVGGLRSSVGCVVTGVERASYGEFYFPLAIAILFHLYLFEDATRPERATVLYCVPILLLTLADAVAALVGVHYGRWHYTTADGKKSTEGSLAFFFCAFLVVHVPVLLATDVGRAEALLIAVLLAGLGMMFEAISWAGLDNLFLPLVSYLLLKIYLDLPLDQLTARVAITGGLMLFVLVYQSRTTLQGSAVLGACLVGYVSWALGDWRWLVPPMLLFVTYTLVSPRTEANSRRVHSVHAVLCVSSAGLIWLFLSRIFDRPEFYYLFTLAFAAQLALIGMARMGYDYPRLSAVALLSVCVAKGWLVLFLPYIALEWGSPRLFVAAAVGLAAVALAALMFYLLQPDVHNCPLDTPRWLRQAASAALGSALGLVAMYRL
jgi:phytol kinase